MGGGAFGGYFSKRRLRRGFASSAISLKEAVEKKKLKPLQRSAALFFFRRRKPYIGISVKIPLNTARAIPAKNHTKEADRLRCFSEFFLFLNRRAGFLIIVINPTISAAAEEASPGTELLAHALPADRRDCNIPVYGAGCRICI